MISRLHKSLPKTGSNQAPILVEIKQDEFGEENGRGETFLHAWCERTTGKPPRIRPFQLRSLWPVWGASAPPKSRKSGVSTAFPGRLRPALSSERTMRKRPCRTAQTHSLSALN